MADNTVLNTGSGGDTIASDDIAGVKHQRVKLSLGADGTAADAPVGGGVEAGTLRVTLASDSTGVLSVDDNGSSLTVDNGGTFAVQATLAAETTKVIGTVNVAAAQTLATVTNVATIGTSVTPGTAAANLGKAEDAAHTSGDVGVMSLAVRRDADTALATTDGDYAPLQVNAAGSLKVAITAGAGSGGTSIADGASFTRDTTSLTPVGGVVEASAPTVTAGDAVALSLTTGGAVRVAVASGGIAGAVVDSVAGATDEGVLAVAVRDDALATLTPVDGDYTQLRTNARGAQWVALDSTVAQTVTLAAGTNNVGDVDVLTVPADPFGANADAASATGSISAKLRFIASTGIPVTGTVTVGSHAVTNAGTFATQVDGAALTALQLIDNACIADDAAFTPATTGVHMAGFTADETATDSVDEGDGGAARMTLDRKQIVSSYAHAAGGATPGRLVSAASTNGTVVKASGGTLYALVVTNINAAIRYLKVYNSTSVTVGTTTPTWTFAIPASTTGAGFNVPIPACGIAFGTGICLGMTTGIADNDTGAVAANEIIANYAFI